MSIFYVQKGTRFRKATGPPKIKTVVEFALLTLVTKAKREEVVDNFALLLRPITEDSIYQPQSSVLCEEVVDTFVKRRKLILRSCHIGTIQNTGDNQVLILSRTENEAVVSCVREILGISTNTN